MFHQALLKWTCIQIFMNPSQSKINLTKPIHTSWLWGRASGPQSLPGSTATRLLFTWPTHGPLPGIMKEIMEMRGKGRCEEVFDNQFSCLLMNLVITSNEFSRRFQSSLVLLCNKLPLANECNHLCSVILRHKKRKLSELWFNGRAREATLNVVYLQFKDTIWRTILRRKRWISWFEYSVWWNYIQSRYLAW